MRNAALGTFLLAMSGSLVPAQGWSITANAPIPATAFAGTLGGVTNTLPAGPVPPGTIVSSSASGSNWSASAGASWSPGVPSQTAPLAFTTNCGAAASVGPPSGFASASVAATVDFTLQSPQPLGGRLSLRATWGSYGGNSTGAIQLDVAADGVVEFVASQSTPTGIAYDVPVPFGVTTIRVVYQANYVVGFSPNNGGVSISLQAQFFPNEVAVHSFDTTGAGSTLGITHTVPNTVTISLNPNLTPVLLAFGFQPTLVPLGPSVTQLVTLDSLFAVGSMTLILPPLPSGTALYCQGLTYFGAYGSTNSVRAIWP